jgi:pyridoxamine 5'-phosphate oxidase
MNDLAKFILFSGGARYTLILLKNWRQKGAVRALSNVSDLRKEYSNVGLNEGDKLIKQGPFALFKAWLNEACARDVLEPNAMCLSTCQNNKPSARYVLLKGCDESGFIWYTNYNSRKSEDLLANPNAALTFWWGPLERSVRIEGVVERISEEESDAYFRVRPRGSQLGAWASNQSSTVSSREVLDDQEKEVAQRFLNVEHIPRPPHWGGFRMVPSRVEFWKGRASRVHDRILFEQQTSGPVVLGSQAFGGEWTSVRLQP